MYLEFSPRVGEFIGISKCPKGSRLNDNLRYIDYNNDGKYDEITQYHLSWLANTNIPYFYQEMHWWNGSLSTDEYCPGYSLGWFEVGSRHSFLDLCIDNVTDQVEVVSQHKETFGGSTDITNIIKPAPQTRIIMSRAIKRNQQGIVSEITLQYPNGSTEQWTRENGWPWQQAQSEYPMPEKIK